MWLYNHQGVDAAGLVLGLDLDCRERWEKVVRVKKAMRYAASYAALDTLTVNLFLRWSPACRDTLRYAHDAAGFLACPWSILLPCRF